MRYSAQSERLYRRAVEDFDRIRALGPSIDASEPPSEPLVDQTNPNPPQPAEPAPRTLPPPPEPPPNPPATPGARLTETIPTITTVAFAIYASLTRRAWLRKA
jgi:hypothetical protein